MKPSLPLLSSVPLLLWALCAAASAQEPIVRTSMAQPQAELWVGQRTSLVVELLVPGFFSGSPSFDLPDPPGLILIPPAGSPIGSTESIGGISYTRQRHEIALFSRRAGEQTIPPFAVRFGFKRQPLDPDVVAANGTTEAVRFTTKFPPGAENLGSILSARGLAVSEKWTPEPGKTKAGDAFTRTILFSAPNVPAMAFPPFPAGKVDGLAVYPKAPEVLDHTDRGSLSGKRRDSVTYVCERAGRFTLPATRLTWFDLESKQLRTIDFPERIFDVAPNPALASAAPTAGASAAISDGTRKRLIISFLTCILLAGCVFVARMPRVWKRVRQVVSVFRPVHLAPLQPPPAQANHNQRNLP